MIGMPGSHHQNSSMKMLSNLTAYGRARINGDFKLDFFTCFCPPLFISLIITFLAINSLRW